ncbi:MAG: hypothetical protein Q3961_04375, partial [Bifidobacteriaceae bacterium]|nr:hypothetical protein [Bifidobacteriaceae bacterium]
DNHIRLCTKFTHEFDRIQNALARAYSLYSQTESHVENLISQLLTVFPFIGAFSIGARAAYHVSQHGLSSQALINTIEDTSMFQESLLRFLALSAMPLQHSSIIQNPFAMKRARNHSQEPMPALTSLLAAGTAPFMNKAQGNNIELTQQTPSKPVVQEMGSMQDTISQLRRLSNQTYAHASNETTGLSYGTIAIQRLQHFDNTQSWIVLIPGTDGMPDSPFGWPQNLELSSPAHQMNADSARMVRYAMKQAGIQPYDNVTLVGHSQGGLVAASIASGDHDFSIRHVITAGSPIANHRIPQHVQVTSIEMKTELVHNLDAQPNPTHRENWVTIRGNTQKLSKPHTLSSSTPQEQSYDKHSSHNRNTAYTTHVKDARAIELTHDLKYHEASFKNAQQIGSEKLRYQEEDFKQIHGNVKKIETTYWQGRMKR